VRVYSWARDRTSPVMLVYTVCTDGGAADPDKTQEKKIGVEAAVGPYETQLYDWFFLSMYFFQQLKFGASRLAP